MKEEGNVSVMTSSSSLHGELSLALRAFGGTRVWSPQSLVVRNSIAA
jgi:hypothetical protein